MLKRKERRFTMKFVRENFSDFIKFCTPFRIFYIQEHTVVIYRGWISIWIYKQIINHFIIKIIMLAIIEGEIVQTVFVLDKDTSEFHWGIKEIIYKFLIHINMGIADCIPFYLMQNTVFPFYRFYILLHFFSFFLRYFYIANTHDREMVMFQMTAFIYIKCKLFFIHSVAKIYYLFQLSLLSGLIFAIFSTSDLASLPIMTGIYLKAQALAFR